MNLHRFIRKIYYVLFFLTPLVMSATTSEIFEFNKMIFIYLCTVVIAGAWLIDLCIYKRTIQKSRVLSFVLFFVLTQILSTIFSIDRHTSVFGYYGRFNGGLLSIFSYATLLFVFMQVFTKEYVKTLLKVSVASSIVVMIWGLSGTVGKDFSCLLFAGELSTRCWTDQFQPEVRMFSTLGQPNWLGAYLAIHTFIGALFVLQTFLKKNALEFTFSLNYSKELVSNWSMKSIFYIFYCLLTITCIYLSSSRSSLLAVGIGFGFCVYVLAWKYFRKFTKLFLGGIIIAFVAITFYLATLDLSSIKQTNVTESFDIRKVVWKGAVDLGMKYPLLGTGVETFAYSYYFTRPPQHNLTSEWDFLYNKAHNEFLNYFATTGFIGLIAYLMMIGFISWILIKNVLDTKESEYIFLNLALLGAYITIHVTNFFGFSTTTVQLLFYLIPGFMYAWNRIPSEAQVTARTSRLKYVGVVVTFLVSCYLIIEVMSYHRADKLYAQANKHIGSDYQTAVTLLDTAIRIHYEHVYEDKLSSVLASLAYILNTQETKDQELVKQLVELSDTYNQKTLLLSSQNVLYWKTKAKNDYLFYDITKDKKYINSAIEALENAKQVSPTDPKLLHSQALFYSIISAESTDGKIKSEYKNKALAEINKAIALKPGYTEALEMKKDLEKK